MIMIVSHVPICHKFNSAQMVKEKHICEICKPYHSLSEMLNYLLVIKVIGAVCGHCSLSYSVFYDFERLNLLWNLYKMPVHAIN